ncbi:early nodulin-16-like isoform X2 [Panicum virgatum]|uniref:early nodulin-16-like isoform X2 n=1 Tax=Panicum virgatum TaxID=38727 RepID=UPI0019D6872F|nr:early nodulin-16-like isoform X2 [Panicum virgatum]
MSSVHSSNSGEQAISVRNPGRSPAPNRNTVRRGHAGLGHDGHRRRRPGLDDRRRLHRLGQRQDVQGGRQTGYPSAEHTVTEVGKNDYFACAGGSALSNDRSGSTNVTLTGPGTRYFICNIPGHCTIGMRLAVAVAGDGSPPVVTSAATGTGSRIRPRMGPVAAAAAGAMIKLAL